MSPCVVKERSVTASTATPKDELDAKVISELRSKGLAWFQFLVHKAGSFRQNALNEKNK